jgi:hypothetical protein
MLKQVKKILKIDPHEIEAMKTLKLIRLKKRLWGDGCHD